MFFINTQITVKILMQNNNNNNWNSKKYVCATTKLTPK